MKVDAIAATGDIASARAAKAATSEIPSSSRSAPIRSATACREPQPAGRQPHRRQSLLVDPQRQAPRAADRDRAPGARIALVMNPDNFTAKAEQQDCIAGAHALNRELVVVNARKPDEIAGALAEAQRLRADSYITATDPLILDRRGEIVTWGQARGLPGVGFVRQFATSGALISYGPSIVWMYRQAGRYVGAILKGAKPRSFPSCSRPASSSSST
jgi:putative ABC transport system substrate-binding protein